VGLAADITVLQKQLRAVIPFIIRLALSNIWDLPTVHTRGRGGLCASLGSCAPVHHPSTLLMAASVKQQPRARSCMSTDTETRCEPHPWSGCWGKGGSQTLVQQGQKGAASSPHPLQADLDMLLLCASGLVSTPRSRKPSLCL